MSDLREEYTKIEVPRNLKKSIKSFNDVDLETTTNEIMSIDLLYNTLKEIGAPEKETYIVINDIMKNGAQKMVIAYNDDVKKFCKENQEEIIEYFLKWVTENFSYYEYEDDAMELLDTYTKYDQYDEKIEDIREGVDTEIIAYCYSVQKWAPMFRGKKFDIDIFMTLCEYFDGGVFNTDLDMEALYWIYYFCIEGVCWNFEKIEDRTISKY